MKKFFQDIAEHSQNTIIENAATAADRIWASATAAATEAELNDLYCAYYCDQEDWGAVDPRIRHEWMRAWQAFENAAKQRG